MEFSELIRTRKSIRKFSSESIDIEMVNSILENLNTAPSAGNLQAFEVYKVIDKEIKLKIVRASFSQMFIAEADIVLVFCANPNRNKDKYHERGINLYAIQDATIAATYAMLSATNNNLGSVWIGAFNPDEVKKVLNLPDYLVPVVILPIGKPAMQAKMSLRRSINELIHEC